MQTELIVTFQKLLFFITMNIFVTKLNYGTTEDSLRGLFEEFGEVSSAKVIMDRDTGRSKGYGFVEMPDASAAQNAINELNESEFEDRTIVVKKANPRESGGGGRGGYKRY